MFPRPCLAKSTPLSGTAEQRGPAAIRGSLRGTSCCTEQPWPSFKDTSRGHELVLLIAGEQLTRAPGWEWEAQVLGLMPRSPSVCRSECPPACRPGAWEADPCLGWTFCLAPQSRVGGGSKSLHTLVRSPRSPRLLRDVRRTIEGQGLASG